MKAKILEHSKIPSTLQDNQYLPIPEASLSQFESKHHIELPHEYRQFLLHVNNGGIGPAKGIIPLDLGHFYENLDLPWTNPSQYNQLFRYDGNSENEEEFDDRVDALLDDEDSVECKIYDAKDHGTITLVDNGCGSTTILVVSGDRKGEIWLDLTVNEDGLVFLAKNFLEWHLSWLQAQVEKISEKNQAISERISIREPSIPHFSNTKSLHAFLGIFKGGANKEPVFDMLERLLQANNLPKDVILAIVDYLVENPEFKNYSLALKFIDIALQDFQHWEPSALKPLLCTKGKAHVGIQEYVQAKSCFDNALTLEMPHFPKGTLKDEHLRLLALSLLCLERHDEAESLLLRPRETMDIENAVFLLMDLYEKFKDFERTLLWGELLLGSTLLDENGKYEYNVSPIYLYLTYASIRMGNTVDAEKYLEQLSQIEQNPQNIPYGQIALILFEEGFYKKSLQFLDMYASLPISRNVSYWVDNLRGCCYADMGNHKKGIAHFIKSFNGNGWIVPYCNLIRPYIHLNKLDKAQQVFDDILKFDPYYSWNYYQFSLYHIKEENPKKALDLLQKALGLGLDIKVIKEDKELASIIDQL
ncbi:SMI1/KNR4 family protein [Flagellimonas meishanensis]|uniref:SMI1/KNR4 family protein n=1 Tax=Flagellimonas meishanensis TaxID=2873264 RepID=UPI001CA626A3|nr:SMI1/KNR4 family protein [[Muricauda] meishanensis]